MFTINKALWLFKWKPKVKKGSRHTKTWNKKCILISWGYWILTVTYRNMTQLEVVEHKKNLTWRK
jgi:hypothetical protein